MIRTNLNNILNSNKLGEEVLYLGLEGVIIEHIHAHRKTLFMGVITVSMNGKHRREAMHLQMAQLNNDFDLLLYIDIHLLLVTSENHKHIEYVGTYRFCLL